MGMVQRRIDEEKRKLERNLKAKKFIEKINEWELASPKLCKETAPSLRSNSYFPFDEGWWKPEVEEKYFMFYNVTLEAIKTMF